MRFRGICLYTLLILPAAVAAEDFQAEGKQWWSYVEHLANDSMEGRRIGTKGFRRASDYVAAEFHRFGLKPAGTNGYFQPIEFTLHQIDESQSSVDLVRDGSDTKLVLGDDAAVSLHMTDPAREVEAPMVFAGYGLRIPEANYDDLAGLDLKGKVVVFLAGGPPSVSGALKSHYSSTGERWKALREAGAIGLISIANPKAMDIPWARATLARTQPATLLADPSLNETGGMRFSLRMNPAKAEKLFTGSGRSFSQILAAADNHQPLPHFVLPGQVRANVAFRSWQAESRNIAAVLPGSDPRRRNEYVVMSAHLDHLGTGQPINGDRIYNGAMDDASGIASILQIGERLSREPEAPARSVLFLAVTGEESGLLGSRYFSLRPTVPASDIVADINLDMFLPLHPLRYLEVQGLEESTLGRDIRAAAAEHGVEVQTDKEPQRNLFIRSDQYSFIRRGVPALAFKFGYVSGSPEEKLHKDWLRNRYHAPSDDLQQPVDQVAAAKFNAIIADLLARVANAPEKPAWNTDSFFRRFQT